MPKWGKGKDMGMESDEEAEEDYGWEEFEALEDFEQRKQLLKSQGINLKEEDMYKLHPYQLEQCIMDAFRLGGAFVFLTDLCLKIGYFQSSKFIDL